MGAIFKREFKSYFHNVTGHIFISFLLLFAGVCVTIYNLTIGYSSFSFAMEWTGYAFILIVPIITMRSLSEDKANRTDKLLFSLPIKTSEIVMGKFAAILAVFVIPIAIMLIYPIILSLYGHMYYASSYSAILALFLLGMALISIGMFISSLTESQVISAVVSFGVLLALMLLPLLIQLIPSTAIVSFFCFIIVAAIFGFIVWRLTKNQNAGIITSAVFIIPLCVVYFFKSSLFEGLFTKVVGSFSLLTQFYNLNSGVFDLRCVLFFISVTVFFLFLCVQSLEHRRLN